MAIDPKLLVIKPVDELTEVTGLQDGDLLFYDGSGNLKRISIETFNNLSKTATPLKPTDATPTVDGLYMPTEIGTYANAGGLIAEDGFDTLFYFNGTTWTKRALPYPKASNNLPQFADLNFPVTNTATEKVQCVDNFVPYQLLDGKTSTSADTPSTSPTIWKAMGEVNIFNNTYTTNPSQLVPTELLYDDIDNTPALTTYKRVSEEEGVDVNYLQTSTWYDGSIIDDSKLDGFIYKKISGNYVVRKIDSKAILKVGTIADLRNFNGYYIGQEISLLGYYTSGDKKPLIYKFSLNTTADNGGNFIRSSKGLWTAQFASDEINILDFGAKNDGSEDIGVALQKAIDSIATTDLSLGRNVIFFPKGNYLMTTGIVKSSTTGLIFKGQGQMTTVLKINITTVAFAFQTYLATSFLDMKIRDMSPGAASTKSNILFQLNGAGGGRNFTLDRVEVDGFNTVIKDTNVINGDTMYISNCTFLNYHYIIDSENSQSVLNNWTNCTFGEGTGAIFFVAGYQNTVVINANIVTPCPVIKFKNLPNKYTNSGFVFINPKLEWTSNNFTGNDETPKFIDADGIYISANVRVIGGALRSVTGFWNLSRLVRLKNAASGQIVFEGGDWYGIIETCKSASNYINSNNYIKFVDCNVYNVDLNVESTIPNPSGKKNTPIIYKNCRIQNSSYTGFVNNLEMIGNYGTAKSAERSSAVIAQNNSSTIESVFLGEVKSVVYDFMGQNVIIDKIQILKKSSGYGQIITFATDEAFANIIASKTIASGETSIKLFDVAITPQSLKKIYVRFDNSTGTTHCDMYARIEYFSA